MPNGADRDAVSSNAVENDIRSPGDRQFSHPRLGTAPAQTRVSFQRLDDCDDPCSQTPGGVRFVESHKRLNFSKPRWCERRPDNFDQ
jgi:hypothetical protein